MSDLGEENDKEFTSKELLEHLENLRQSARDEIVTRIAQRDKYIIQKIISIGAVLLILLKTDALKLSDGTVDLSYIFLCISAISIYFTYLIIYSYQVHSTLASYLHSVVEQKQAKLLSEFDNEDPKVVGWEQFYKENAHIYSIGIRKSFFLIITWIIFSVAIIYTWFGPSPMNAGKWIFVIIISLGIIILQEQYEKYFNSKK